MKKLAIVVLAVLLSGAGLALAADGDAGIGVKLDVTYVSKWLSKGSYAYGNQGAVFETIDLDFFGSGFGAKVTHRSATSSGYAKKQRFDYRPYFKFVMNEGDTWQTNANVSVGYENYYKVSRRNANSTWEWVGAFAFPNLLGECWTPAYVVHYESQADSDNPNYGISGWVHRFLLSYDFQTEIPLKFTSEIAYSDGLGGKTYDWAYANFGLTTSYKLSDNVKLVPGIYHQVTMDKAVNPDKDLTYAKVSLKVDF